MILVHRLWWAAEAREPGRVPVRDLVAAPVRAARWLAAGVRARRAARRDWKAGADLTTGWTTSATPTRELPPWHDVPPRDSSPACQAGRPRCRECRLGGDCRDNDPAERAAYWRPAQKPLHLRVLPARLAHLRDLREAVRLAPATWRERLGRPVRVGAAVAGPLGVLP